MISVAVVPFAVPAVHEQMKQRAEEQQQIRQDTKEMGRVLGYQEECGGGQKGEQRETCS